MASAEWKEQKKMTNELEDKMIEIAQYEQQRKYNENKKRDRIQGPVRW